ncbi:MAG: tetratricopeptide repeat protein [Planctomycetales bacterium]|nr:tetratricopeptide repeat protein [Planctomycetales bacterium]
MIRRTLCTAAIAVFGIIALQAVDVRTASAKLLSKDDLKDCQLHVVGIYSPKDHGDDDRVFVEVKPTGKPIVLVLSGYFGAQWNVKIDSGADVRQVIIPGYFEHYVTGLPESVPVEFITYFPKDESENSDYFWAYSWHSNNGRELRSRLTEITGLEISSFQGEYSGSSFVVDGKRGLITDQGPVPTRPESQTQVESDPGQLLRAQAAQVELQRQKLMATLGENHPSVVQLNKSLDLIRAELSRIGAARLSSGSGKQANRSTPDIPADTDARKTIELLVRQSFELETQLQMARVEKAQADLQRIKSQLQERQQNAEQIIKDRVDQLVQQSEMAAQKDADTPASVLSAEGWAAWNKRDWRTALAKFQAALSKDPEYENAQNGLGWTYVHLQEHDKAIAEFKKLLKKSPTHGGAMNGLGQSLLMQGKLDDAERELLKATEDAISQWGEAKAATEGVAAWYGLVRTYQQKKDYLRAKNWAQRLLKHKPGDETMNAMLREIDAAESAKTTQ